MSCQALLSLGKKVPITVVVAVPVAVGGEEVLMVYRHSLSFLFLLLLKEELLLSRLLELYGRGFRSNGC